MVLIHQSNTKKYTHILLSMQIINHLYHSLIAWRRCCTRLTIAYELNFVSGISESLAAAAMFTIFAKSVGELRQSIYLI